jgi:hypothetical protein
MPDNEYVGEWLSLVEHLVRDQGVGGSNPLSPTIIVSYHLVQPIGDLVKRSYCFYLLSTQIVSLSVGYGAEFR